jgi:hypothetical protein
MGSRAGEVFRPVSSNHADSPTFSWTQDLRLVTRATTNDLDAYERMMRYTYARTGPRRHEILQVGLFPLYITLSSAKAINTKAATGDGDMRP